MEKFNVNNESFFGKYSKLTTEQMFDKIKQTNVLG